MSLQTGWWVSSECLPRSESLVIGNCRLKFMHCFYRNHLVDSSGIVLEPVVPMLCHQLSHQSTNYGGCRLQGLCLALVMEFWWPSSDKCGGCVPACSCVCTIHGCAHTCIANASCEARKLLVLCVGCLRTRVCVHYGGNVYSTWF